jgi:hypothetical protein
LIRHGTAWALILRSPQALFWLRSRRKSFPYKAVREGGDE